MPVTEGIIVPITADASGLEKGMASAKTAVSSFGTTTQAAIRSIGDPLSEANRRLESFKRLSQELKSVKLNESFNLTKNELKDLNSAISNANLGITVETNLIKKLKSETQSSNFSKPFNDAYGAVRKLAYILPGIGIAGIFNLAFQGLATVLNESGESAKRAEQSLNDYTEAMGNAEATGRKNVITAGLLIDTINDESASHTKRTNALRQLQKEYPGYFANQGIDINNTKALREQYDKLTDALLRKAKADAIVNLISQQYGIIAKEESKTVQQKVHDLGALSYGVAFLKGAFNGVASIGANEVFAGIKNSKDVMSDASQQIINLTAELKELHKEQENDKLDKVITPKEDKIAKIYEQLKKSLLEINGLYRNRNISNDIFNSDSIKAYETAIKELLGQGIDPLSNAIQELNKKQSEFLTKIGNRGKISEVVFSIRSKDQKNELEQNNPSHLYGNGKLGSGIFDEDFDRMATKRQKELDKLNDELVKAKALANEAAAAFVSMFDDILRGTNIGDAIGNMFKRIAKDIAEAAIKAFIFSAVFNSIAPGAGGVVSAGKGGAGFFGLFKNMLGLASGGITNGPTMAMIGEGKEREVVTPLSQLKNIIGSVQGNQSIPVPKLFMKGNDFWIMYQKSQRLNQRTY